MEGILKGASRSASTAALRREAEAEKQKARQLVAEVRQTREALENLQKAFNLVSDPDLIEAVIYEELAMGARYRHLMKLARTAGIRCEAYE